ncbi:unnamed protein product, partial [Iphiclides podalirius]
MNRRNMRFAHKYSRLHASRSDWEYSNKDIKTVELIKAIQEQPCLWNRMSEEYRDRYKRDEAWQKVYTKLNPDYMELKNSEQIDIGVQITKKWYNIRDSYAKRKRSVKSKPYLYSDLLSFMDIHYIGESGSTSNTNSEQKAAEDSNSAEDTEESLQAYPEEIYIDIDEDECGTPAKLSRTERESTAKTEEHQQDDKLIKVLESLAERETDEDRSFFAAVLSSVSSLSEDSKLEFRINVLQLIQTLKKKDKAKDAMKTELTIENSN